MKRRLRIAHCTQATYGGTHRYIMDLIKRQEHDITVICPEDEFLARDASDHGIRTMPVEMGRNISPLRDLLAAWELYRIFRSEKFDVVHLHSSKAGFLGRFAARLAGVPRVVYQPHGWAFDRLMPRIKLAVYVTLERFAALLGGTVICISNAELIDAVEFRIAPREKLSLVLSGVDLDMFAESVSARRAVRSDLGLSDSVVAIGFVGRLDPKKGPDLAIQAAKLVAEVVPYAHFFIVGDGPLRGQVEEACQEGDFAKSITFLGWQTDIAKLISAFDIGIVPSRAEGFGLAAAEFMAMGRPVVATRVGGLNDVVADGESGVLVAPNDPEGIAAALIALVTDKEKRLHLGHGARERARLMFNADRMAREIEAVYAGNSRHDGAGEPPYLTSAR